MQKGGHRPQPRSGWLDLSQITVLVRGAGDLGSGVIHRLHRSGFTVLVVDLPRPTCLRRAVSFSSAIWEGEIVVEGVHAILVEDLAQARERLAEGKVPVFADHDGGLCQRLQPQILVDATIAKRNLGVGIDQAPVVIALGPGFRAGHDVHAVIETNRGHDLGKVYFQGSAEPDTATPSQVLGHDNDRLLRAPCEGTVSTLASIGDPIVAGQRVASVDGRGLDAAISGTLRGLVHDGLTVAGGAKVADIDPRASVSNCFTISDKARAVAGGVLEAILTLATKGPPGACPGQSVDATSINPGPT